MSKNWVISPICDAADSLAAELEISHVTAGILLCRGISSPDAARKFFDPCLSDISDPFQIPDMESAADRIIKAIKRGEKIAIFGDYDVDGITGTALAARFLRAVGGNPELSLPDRMGEGYGLTKTKVLELHKQGVNLIITVDNGTRSFEAIDCGKKLGIDIVVTDHHDIGDKLPNAFAIVNPKRLDNSHPHYHLSGCGVALMLVIALRKKLREINRLPTPEPNIGQYLDLVALGTIADVVPLTGTNRILVKYGLTELARATKPGIKALLSVSGTNPLALTPYSVAFQLAPRINAAGRIGEAVPALSLLLSEDFSESISIANVLDRMNRERQKIEGEIVDEALEMLMRDPDLNDKSAIVLAKKGWHVGIIGIVASKLVQKFDRPAIIVTLDSNPPRGSARGVEGIDLVETLSSVENLLIRYGGHAMAAGLSIEKDRIDEFALRLNEICKKTISPVTGKRLSIDAEVSARDLTPKLFEEISRIGPFGAGNPEPVFALTGLDISGRKIVGNGHLKLKVKSDGFSFDAIGFGMAGNIPSEAMRVSLAFVPEFNTWNGITSMQLKIRDIKIEG